MIRLGKIAFANCDFPYYAMEHGRIGPTEIRITEAHPVELARRLFNDELDISPISSIMYGKRSDLLILPGLSITSNDFTKSVLICANGKMSLSDLEGETLCIPETTASSATLIKIILWLRGVHVNMKHCSGTDIEEMLKKGDAALLIGDSAIQAIGKYRIIADLGNEWKKVTGKKMVYALWVVKEDFAKRYPEKVRYALDALLSSKDYAYDNINEIAGFIASRKKIDCSFMREYLHTLNYDFDSESIESLELFFRYARECGIVDEVKLRFFETTAGI
ncbi:MAG: menaquinone biosynthesis protein [Candidatus Methanoperedens sp.]|nr:menaquinone biosynthesis protein [Candidatus Methanoperedens sp.]MCZ7358575.1 menaquinone biosynthesis protein [Candidatus Methanoperedens sp.]HLB71979.1 menaquinone biosynthesis protein [Candidatus Methanoperedens sp.]